MNLLLMHRLYLYLMELSGTEAQDSGRDYASEIDLLDNDLRALEKRIDDNPFVAEEDKIRVSEHVKEIYHDVAFTRQDTQKLYD